MCKGKSLLHASARFEALFACKDKSCQEQFQQGLRNQSRKAVALHDDRHAEGFQQTHGACLIEICDRFQLAHVNTICLLFICLSAHQNSAKVTTRLAASLH